MKHYDGDTMLYVLENDSFKENDIKIGITRDIKQRLGILNTSVPTKFTVSYMHWFPGSMAATYEVLAHNTLDFVRSENGEFFKIDATTVIDLFETWGKNQLNEEVVERKEIEPSDASPRRVRFSFSMIGLKVGDVIINKRNGDKATVHSDTHIMWRDEVISLSESARIIKGEVDLDDTNNPAGPVEWLHNGQTLDSLRK